MTARVIAVANQKGGVGKTTTAVSLAWCWSEAGTPVRLVDLDPHASLSEYLLGDAARPGPGAEALFEDPAPPVASLARSSRIPGLDLVPATAAMARTERQLATVTGAGRRLRAQLCDDDFDGVTILDCLPTLGVLMVNALTACDLVLIPTQTEPMALRGLAGMLRTLDMLERSLGRRPVHRILATLYDRRTRAGVQSLRALEAAHAGHLIERPIPIDTRLRDASRAGEPIGRFAPDSRAARAYADLYRELAAMPVPRFDPRRAA